VGSVISTAETPEFELSCQIMTYIEGHIALLEPDPNCRSVSIVPPLYIRRTIVAQSRLENEATKYAISNDYSFQTVQIMVSKV
jgi:hypothetical protein